MISISFFLHLCFALLLSLSLQLQTAGYPSGYCAGDCMHLPDVQILEFRKNRYATYPDRSLHPQLQCIEGDGCKESKHINLVTCYNEGPGDDGHLQWSCDCEIDRDVEFGYTDPTCQGYFDPDDDEFIFRGSCVLRFSLFYTGYFDEVEENLTLSGIIGGIIALCCCYFCCIRPCTRRNEHYIGHPQRGNYTAVNSYNGGGEIQIRSSSAMPPPVNPYYQQPTYNSGPVIATVINEPTAPPTYVEERVVYKSDHHNISGSSSNHWHGHSSGPSHHINGQSSNSHSSSGSHHISGHGSSGGHHSHHR